jgi:hypothetical protein
MPAMRPPTVHQSESVAVGLVEVKDVAILAISAAEAQGFFGHCAYKKVSGSLL